MTPASSFRTTTFLIRSDPPDISSVWFSELCFKRGFLMVSYLNGFLCLHHSNKVNCILFCPKLSAVLVNIKALSFKYDGKAAYFMLPELFWLVPGRSCSLWLRTAPYINATCMMTSLLIIKDPHEWAEKNSHSKLYYSVCDLFLWAARAKQVISSLSEKGKMEVNRQLLSKHWGSVSMRGNHTDQIYSRGEMELEFGGQKRRDMRGNTNGRGW